MGVDDGGLARVVIPFGAVVRHPTEGISYDVDSGVPAFHDLEIRDEVWPHWMALARDSAAHALAAQEANPGYSADREREFGEFMQLEMRSAMSAICSVAFALEAFSASVIYHNARASVQGRGAPARIHQSLCRSFRIRNDRSAAIRSDLGKVFSLRNRAVHPPGEFALVAYRPDFRVHVHPRFVEFSASAAHEVVAFAGGLVQELLLVPRPDCQGLVSWCTEMKETLAAARAVSNAFYPF